MSGCAAAQACPALWPEAGWTSTRLQKESFLFYGTSGFSPETHSYSDYTEGKPLEKGRQSLRSTTSLNREKTPCFIQTLRLTRVRTAHALITDRDTSVSEPPACHSRREAGRSLRLSHCAHRVRTRSGGATSSVSLGQCPESERDRSAAYASFSASDCRSRQSDGPRPESVGGRGAPCFFVRDGLARCDPAGRPTLPASPGPPTRHR